mgnify:CR=1 FL=1
MNGLAPIARIIIRYGVGAFLGAEVGEILATDPDVINYTALAIGAGVAAINEYLYSLAVKHGWAT